MAVQHGVKVWDPLVRAFHWSLATAFFVAWLSEGEPAWLHTSAGYGALGLVAIRVVWGFVGPANARFSHFVVRPLTALGYLARELTGRARRHLTHNPAGGWMVVALLVAVTGTALSGMTLYAAHDGAGPLAAWLPRSESLAEALEEVHEAFANGTLFLVGLHVAGVVVSSLAHRENLVASMLHGFKRPAGHA